MTCLFSFSGLRIVNYHTFTSTFLILADGEFELQLPLLVVCDYLFKSPGRRIANCITFTFACFIPPKSKWQSFVAAWYRLQLQFWQCPELINVTATALGRNLREPINNCSYSF